ncbi:MAG: hypothetical protein GWN01_01285, partial [Nitrosopumilaceae archaeon]|nr:hypothetical protein [Nitrosopumilaceae archaeon]NIU85992.1 hypothetical protein [Nitrosopumilaceae archaeon]NIX60211.1 hypothetical protein [Nitrosopumilaceae archaeon]
MTDEEEEKRGIGTNEPTTKREKVDTAIKSDYTLNVTVDTDKLQELVKSTIENFVKQYMPFNKPIRGHSWEYWQKKLKEDNPDYTDEDVDATIASWEKEEKAKKGYKKSNEETENEDAKQEPDKQTKKLEAEKEQYKIDKALVDDLV